MPVVPSFWRPRRVVAVLVAMMPLYGYMVHAARDGQTTALIIGLCWLITGVLAVGAAVLLVIRPSPASHRRVERAWVVGLVLAAVVGWGGVRAAFFELIAG